MDSKLAIAVLVLTGKKRVREAKISYWYSHFTVVAVVFAAPAADVAETRLSGGVVPAIPDFQTMILDRLNSLPIIGSFLSSWFSSFFGKSG